ncbi:hypothetical protein GQ44DRAFT_779267 [Phaeosphaeriaceae sp. PMI808]|nr:hypothetical protein GQ44DRAFT_779267 [Phaeosphaeriaceae sp. PMI808]
MTGRGINLAVTKDGGAYNKLQRPHNYLSSATNPPLAPKNIPRTEALPAKRKHEHTAAISIYKRHKLEQEPGMRPVLGCDIEGHSSDGSIDEALTYLRDVRSQASNIPHLLVGSTTHGHDNTIDTQTVFFREGTCIALNDQRVASHSDDTFREEAYDSSPQDRLYELLLKRFHNLRTKIVSACDKTHAHPAGTDSTTTNIYTGLNFERDWPSIIDTTYPELHQLLQLDEKTVYKGLQYCTNRIAQVASISPYTSCWIWSLLALVGDVGTLNNQKISHIRDLGRKAGLLGARLRKTRAECQCLGEDRREAVRKTANTSTDYSKAGNICSDQDIKSNQTQTAAHSVMSTDYSKAGNICGDQDIKSNQIQTAVQSVVAQDNATNASLSLGDVSGSDTEMSMSGDEDQAHHSAEVSQVERARARLLLQLGDRLVRPQLPPPRRRLEPIEGAERQSNRAMRDQDSRPKVSRDEPDGHCSSGCSSTTSNHGRCEGWEEEPSTLNTRVTIEMVLTIVAESFGQRDLLRYRRHW